MCFPFQDGVKFHDVGCNHKKPIICEEVTPEETRTELTATTENTSEMPDTDVTTELHVFLPPVSGIGGGGNHVWNGQNYLLSWVEGVGDLTWEQARDYCEANAMRVVSLDNEEKTEHFFKQVCCCLSINKLCVNNEGVT